MPQVITDRRDIDFVLYEQFNAEQFTQHEKFAEFNKKTFDLIINEARNLAIKEILPTFAEGDREGSLYFWDYEKLIVEGSYSEEEWNDFVSVNYLLEGTDFNFATKRTPVLTFAKEQIEAEKDKIVVVNLSDTAVSGFSIVIGKGLLFLNASTCLCWD